MSFLEEKWDSFCQWLTNVVFKVMGRGSELLALTDPATPGQPNPISYVHLLWNLLLRSSFKDSCQTDQPRQHQASSSEIISAIILLRPSVAFLQAIITGSSSDISAFALPPVLVLSEIKKLSLVSSEDGVCDWVLYSCLGLPEDLTTAVTLLTWEDLQFGKQCPGLLLIFDWAIWLQEPGELCGVWERVALLSPVTDADLSDQKWAVPGVSQGPIPWNGICHDSLGTCGLSRTRHNY